MLHPVFQEDELTLILVGAFLGLVGVRTSRVFLTDGCVLFRAVLRLNGEVREG